MTGWQEHTVVRWGFGCRKRGFCIIKYGVLKRMQFGYEKSDGNPFRMFVNDVSLQRRIEEEIYKVNGLMHKIARLIYKIGSLIPKVDGLIYKIGWVMYQIDGMIYKIN
jgi:hypothetical protein